MIFSCPKCRSVMDPKNINIQEMLGNCVRCNEIFKLDIGSEVQDKPKNSLLMESTSGPDEIAIIFPKRYGLGVFMIFFGGFWDLISGTMFGVWIFQYSKIETFPLILISTFFILGFAILMFGVAQVLMRVAVIAKNGKIKLVRNILGREIISEIDYDKDVKVEKVVRYSSNDVPVYGVRINGLSDKKLTVGERITDEEVYWLRNKFMSVL